VGFSADVQASGVGTVALVPRNCSTGSYSRNYKLEVWDSWFGTLQVYSMDTLHLFNRHTLR
jgi:hypothetical protein